MINVPQIKLALGAKFSSVDNELMILGVRLKWISISGLDILIRS